MKFDLPKINPDANPAFTDARTCAEWLESLPLINVGPAHGKLLGEIEELNCFEMMPSERIKVLELLREPLLFVQSEQARKFTGKAVPLGKQEREIFLNVLALWSALANGWLHCLQCLVQGIGGVSGQAALICQRTLWSSGLKIAEHYKIYQEFSASEWQLLNQTYAFGRSLGVAEKGVSHPSQKSGPEVSCAETFAQVQLLALANPYEHTQRHQALIARWIETWGRMARFSGEPPKDAGGAPLCMDLGAGAFASRAPKDGGAVLYMATDEIGRSLAQRIAALKQGETPDSLGLGKDVTEGLAAQMLVMLHQQWCEDKTARQSQRRGATEHAKVCGSLAAMHYFITGLPFQAQDSAASLTAQQREHLETFGQLSTRTNEDYTVSHGFVLQQWRILDESANGIRLERPREGGAVRFLHQQLVAVRPADATGFSIGSVRWISVSENYVLRIAIRIMPGAPQGIGARLAGINVHSDRLVQALLLPAAPALRAPATLILPAGWFRPKRLVELDGGSSGLGGQVLLTMAIERGSDFERCAFEPA